MYWYISYSKSKKSQDLKARFFLTAARLVDYSTLKRSVLPSIGHSEFTIETINI